MTWLYRSYDVDKDTKNCRLNSSLTNQFIWGFKNSKLTLTDAYINYLTERHQNKMSSSKNFTCKGTLRQVFIRVYRLEIQSVMLVFSIQFCKLLPIYLLSGSSPPRPHVSKYSTVYTDSMWLGGGGGDESCWRPYSAGVWHSISDQIQSLQNC